jgi:putative ATP-dependent endonuclease of the OLD family
MHLASLTVENYRALRTATVGFDQTTVLIGENDCGKSSLLEALAIALDPEAGDEAPRFRPHHFHRTAPRADAPTAGPIRIALRFCERRPGEWDGLADTPLGGLLRPAGKRPRAMVLDIRAAAAPGQRETVAQWRLRAEGAPRKAAITEPTALACLRRLNPLVWLHGGGLVGVAGAPLQRPPNARSMSPETARLVARIEQSHAELVGGTAPDVQAMLGEGFAAARDFIGLAAQHLNGERQNFRQMVAEILDHRHAPPEGDRAAPILRFSSSSAERIGVLALMAALLRALPDSLAAGAEPLWIIEDPEAQLHPMTLASVLTLVGRINWQKILTTHSADVLAAEPLMGVRRLTRHAGTLRAWRVRPQRLSAEDLRRVSYHLRARRGVASFARCWLLVEGETEFWVLPEMANLAGHDFAVEGVVCVEFAQCGLPPLIKLARELGIEWHLLTDGDRAGAIYAEQALRFVRGEPAERRITVLPGRDIETCFYEHGYAPLFERLAGLGGEEPAERVIKRAIDLHSKPLLALELVLAAAAVDAPGVPPPLRNTIEACVRLARGADSNRPAAVILPAEAGVE